MKHIIFTLIALLGSSCAFGADVPQGSHLIAAQNGFVEVKLTSSMSTTSSKPGDPVTAVVMGPQELQGAILEGTVVDAEYDTLHFAFHTLKLMNGKTDPIQCRVVCIVNSKGIAGQDDLGQRIRCDGNGVIGYGIHTAVNEGAEIDLTVWKK
jgi:hypothetical protein